MKFWLKSPREIYLFLLVIMTPVFPSLSMPSFMPTPCSEELNSYWVVRFRLQMKPKLVRTSYIIDGDIPGPLSQILMHYGPNISDYDSIWFDVPIFKSEFIPFVTESLKLSTSCKEESWTLTFFAPDCTLFSINLQMALIGFSIYLALIITCAKWVL
jgi:hypothetical protein